MPLDFKTRVETHSKNFENIKKSDYQINETNIKKTIRDYSDLLDRMTTTIYIFYKKYNSSDKDSKYFAYIEKYFEKIKKDIPEIDKILLNKLDEFSHHKDARNMRNISTDNHNDVLELEKKTTVEINEPSVSKNSNGEIVLSYIIGGEGHDLLDLQNSNWIFPKTGIPYIESSVEDHKISNVSIYATNNYYSETIVFMLKWFKEQLEPINKPNTIVKVV